MHRALSYELDSDHQTAAPHIDDVRMTPTFVFNFAIMNSPTFAAFADILFLTEPHCFQRRRQTNRISAERRRVSARRPGHDFRARDLTPNGMPEAMPFAIATMSG